MATQTPEMWLDPETGEEVEIVNAQGQEVLDPVPMEPPIGYQRTETMFDIIQRQVRDAILQKEIDAQGYETFEEADDFEIGDDFEPYSPHENDLDPDFKQIAKDVEISKKLAEKQTQAAATDPVREDPQPKAEDKSAKKPDEKGDPPTRS